MTMSSLRPKTVAVALFAAALGQWASPCWAQSAGTTGSQLRLSGFGTVGVAHLEEPQGWSYRRDISQAVNRSANRADLDSRLGLQVNYAPTAQVEFVAQAVIAPRAEASNASDNIEWAFAAYRPNANWTLRVGRVNLDAFLLSDHHSVGFSYTFARPPVEFYGQLPSTLDGADLARAWNDGGTLWRVKAFAGRTTSISDTDRIGVHPITGLMASREADGLMLRASVIHARIANNPPELQPLLDALSQFSSLPVADVAAQATALRDHLDINGSSSTYWSLGAQYEHGATLWSAEVTRVTGISAFSAGYATVGRRIGPVTVFGLLSAVATDGSAVEPQAWEAELAPILGPDLAQQAQGLADGAATAINSIPSRQRALSIGARWDINGQIALKTQWDHIRTDANGTALWGGSTLDAARSNVASVVLDFIF